MKKLTSVVVLFGLLLVLTPGAASAEEWDSLFLWCQQTEGAYYVPGDAYVCYVNGSVTVADGDVLNILTSPLLAYKLVIEESGTLTINGTIRLGNSPGPKFGTIENNGTINNNGLISSAGIITNYGELNNNLGTLQNFSAISQFHNYGQLNNYSQFDSWGKLYNYSQFDNLGQLTNYTSGLFENRGFVFNQQGFIANWGLIKNYRCPGEVGVITAGPSNLENIEPWGSIEYPVGQACP